MSILVNIDALVRISNAASSDPSRSYLYGVHVCARRGVAGAVLVATDGHIMAVENDPAGEVAASASGTITLNAIKQIAAAAKIFAKQGKIKPGMLWARILDKGFKIVWGDVETPETNVIGQLWCDGSFPEWSRVIPAHDKITPGFKGALNPELLADLAKTKPGSDNGFTFFQEDAGSASIVRCNSEQWLGVIMPMRTSVDKSHPWFISEQRAKDFDKMHAAA